MTEILAELGAAFRRLRRAPAFTALCIFTLALGIGATTAIFSVVHGVLLQPLPYPEPETLVGVWHHAPGLDMEQAPQSPGTYLWYRQQSDILEAFALYSETRLNLSTGPVPERIQAAAVTPSLFSVLRVPPAHGRGFHEEEGRPGGPPVAVIGDRLWRRRFGGDLAALGTVLQIDGVPRELIGILPPGFAFPRPETDLWIPLPVDPARAPLARFSSPGVGRLAAGISPADATARFEAQMKDLEALFPEDRAAPVLARAGFAPVVRPLRDDLIGDVGQTLWILLAAVGFLLLIACANVANLLLVRTETRRLDSALRAALGAPRGRASTATLAESLLLAAGGGALGVLLAAGGIRLLHGLRPSTLPRIEEIQLDGTVLLAAAALALLTSLAVGLWPAWRAITEPPAAILGGGATAAQQRVRGWGRRLLVVVQTALALVLLSGSGLMLRSFQALTSLDPGFTADQASTFQLALPRSLYPEDTAAASLHHRVLDRLRAIPGIEAAGGTSSLPLGGASQGLGHTVEGFSRDEGAPPPVFEVERVSAGYFAALGIPILQGRALDRSDAEGRSGAVVVNRTLARRFWPDGDAVGRRLRPSRGGEAPWYTVVGVSGDVRSRQLTEEPLPTVYYPLLGQSPGEWVVHELSLVVRSPVPLDDWLPAAVDEVRTLAPELPVAEARTMGSVLARAQGRMRFGLQMLGLATFAALLLAVVGTYGFVSYLAGQRHLEFGVRMSTGATGTDIGRLVLRETLWIAIGGVALGLAGALWLTRWLSGLLFEVTAVDPWVLGTVAAVLVVSVLLAGMLPALRATRLDPITVLRQE